VRSSRLERKLVASILLLFLVPTLVAGGVLFLLYRRGVLADPVRLAAVVGVGFVTMMAYLGTVAHGLGRSLVRTLHEIRFGTELMATVNPAHRLRVETDDDLGALAGEINRLADHLAAARSGLEAEVARATRELAVERQTLAAVLGALGEGVVVITPDGRVTLANPVAGRLLARGESLLGRRLVEFTDREKVSHFLERLRQGRSTTERFTLARAGPAGQTVLETVMTPFFDEELRMIGVVLVLHDVTAPAHSDQAVRRTLDDVLRELRGRLASIRSLSESLLAEPAPTGTEARPLLDAVHREAVRLSQVLAGLASPDALGLGRAPWHFETIGLADLVAMTLRRLGPDRGREVAVEGDLAELPPVGVEASALSASLAHLVRALGAGARPGAAVRLRASRQGRFVQIALLVDAPGAGAAGVVELEQALEDTGPPGLPGGESVRGVVRQHAGEAWAYETEGGLGFRVALPVGLGGEPPPRTGADRAGLVGAGFVSGVAADQGAGARPDFYDLSLFEQMARDLEPADRERPLAELTCVVLDVETTGLRPEAGDRVVSLAGIKVRGGVLRRGETFDALVNPGRPIPPESTRFHGITDDMVAGAPPLDVVLPAFLRFADGAVLVGHEISFDLRFLEAAAGRMGIPSLLGDHAVLDTLRLSEVVHGPLPGHGLDVVASRLGVTVRGRHSALGDAWTTAEVLVRLIALLEKRGIRTLGAAVEAARRSRSSAPEEAAPDAGGPGGGAGA
jgi:DNA polymerase-3 subunit epsilon